MGEIIVKQIDHSFVLENQSLIRRLHEAAFLYTEDINFDSILEFHKKGMVQIFGGFEDGELIAVMTTEFLQYPLKKVVRVIALAGALKKFESFADYIYVWAEANGAKEVEAWCHPSMARLLRTYGYEHCYTVVRKSVSRSLQ